MPTVTAWPPKKKSKAMIAIENANGGRDIRDLILERLETRKRDVDAACSLGLYHGTLSAWIARLSIEQEASEARGRRIQS